MKTIKKSIIIALAALVSVSSLAAPAVTNPVLIRGYDANGQQINEDAWYPSISDAFRNVVTDSVSVVLYGNTVETETITLYNKVSIRSAKAGTADADVTGAPAIDPNGYTVTWNSTSVDKPNCIEVMDGHCHIGDGIAPDDINIISLSGPITFDANGKGRCVLNRSFLRVLGPVTIKNGNYASDLGQGGGAGIFSEIGSIFIDGGVTFIGNKATANTGGAIWTNIDAVIGTCTFKDNSAVKGSALYFTHINNERSYIRLFGAPNMVGDSQIAYLDVNSSLQKSDPISSTAHLNIQVADEFAGRDIIVSYPDAMYRNGVAIPEDLNIVSMLLTDVTLEAVYTEHDANTNRPVIELQKKHVDLTIQKKGMSEGESALFNVKNSSGTVIFNNISVTAGSNGIGSVTIAGLEVGYYTVEEIPAWSWAYTPERTSLRQDILNYPIFMFANEMKETTPAHGESNINNVFSSLSH